MPGKLTSLITNAAVLLPEPLARLYLLGRRQRSGWRVMDPKAQLIGRAIDLVRVPGVMPTPEESRAQMSAMTGRLDRRRPDLARVEDRVILGPEGDLPIRVYAPRTGGAPLPVLCYFHGGGWLQGDLDTHDAVCGKLAAWADCLVVAVDYRLAPEHKFPAAVDDGIAAYSWLRDHARQLGGDPHRVGVAGDSAGGNLSAVISQAVVGTETPLPTCQVLIYPALDMRLDSESHDEMRDGYVIPRDRIIWYLEQYLKDPSQTKHVRASPLLALDLRGQPPTMIVTAGFDPLRDEGAAYGEKLRAADVEVRHREFEGQIHGFISMTAVIPQGDECLQEIAAYLREVL